MNCNVTNNIYNTLLQEGIIDSKHNVIGPIGKSYQVIKEINDEIKNKYGFPIDPNSPSAPDYITTANIKGYLGKGTLTKIFFNEAYENYVEEVINSRIERNQVDNPYTNPEVNFDNNSDQKAWDNLSTKYNNRIIDESDFNDSWQDNEIIDDYEPLNSPTPPPDNDIVDEYPTSFGEWINGRKKVLNNLKKLHDQYFKLDRKDPVLKNINSAIEEIESQLDLADSQNPYNIFLSAVQEMEILDILLDNAKDNPDAALGILEQNDLERRVYDLNYYFLGLDKNLGDVPYPTTTVERTHFYPSFMEHFGQYSKADMDKLQDSIRRLKQKYNTTKKNIVVSALKNNSYVKQHISTGKITAPQIDDIIQKIENNEFEVDKVGSYVLGLASNGGILGQLLYTKKEEATFKENAFVGKKLSVLSMLWEKIKDKKDSEGNFLTNSLFQYDRFGVRANRLISKYTDEFHSLVKSIYNEKSTFNLDKSSSNYSIWMKAEKDNFHRIDVRMFSEVFNKFSNDKRFSSYFSDINSEQITEYENTLKQRLGPVMYKIEKEKAIEMLDDYIFSIENLTLTPRQKVVKNPFAFLQHFNSSEFDKMSVSEGAFLEPSYTRFIPELNSETYYNSQFKKVEDNSDLSMYYAGAYDIMTNYANPTFQSEGVMVGGLDLQSFEDALDRNSYKDLTLFGKISANVKALRRDRLNSYSDNFLANMEDRLSDENHDRQKLVVGYSGDIRNQAAKLAEVYSNLSFEDLVNKAQSKGIDGVKKSEHDLYIKTLKNGKQIKLPLFYELARSVARAELSSVTSSNIQESIHNSAYLAADVRARRSAIGMLEAFKDISQTVNVRKGNTFETKIGDSNIHKMLKMWGQSNIYGEKFAGDMENKGKSIISRVTRQTVFGRRTYTTTDKIALEEIKETLKLNPEAVADNFVYKDESYSVTKDKFGATFTKKKGDVTESITLEQYKDAYLNMIKSKLGTDITIGSLMLGYMDNLRGLFLGLSPRAGIKNRIAGMSQTMSVAASKRFGFSLNDYHSARRFLRGINTRQYLSKSGWTRNQSNPKYIQIEMLEKLVSNLELQQNRADELALEAKFNTNTTTNRIENVKNFFMDFSMNNPERHNQLEIAVSIMMNTKVKDINGVEHSLFDGKTSKFNIYKPGTLELKDEFKTEENTTMWENFQAYTSDNNSNQNADSIAMTTKIRAAIEQTQGNYNNNDIIMLQNSVWGKLATMFTRYFYENTNLQFGKHYLDLRTGEMDIKGRKINMMEHAPVTMTYLMSSFSLPILAGAMSFVAASPWIAGILGVSGAIAAGYAIMNKQFKFESFMSLKEYNLAKDFALETLLLMGKTPLNTFTYGTVNPKFFDNNLEKLQGKRYDGLLTDKERELLSECAQEVATKFQNYTAFTLMAILAKFMFALVAGSDDDDDETYFQKKIKEFVNIENVVNAILNDRNQTLSDINRYVNPSQFYDDATAFAFFRALSRETYIVNKLTTGGYEDKDTSEMLNDVSKLSFIPGLNLIPNNGKKAIMGIFNKDSGVFSDNRVYQGKDELDKLVAKKMKKGEDYYKKEATDKRADLSDDAKKFFTKQVERELEESGTKMSTNDREKEVKSRVRAFLGETFKAKNDTYEEIVNSTIFEDKRKELDEMKANQ